MPTGTIRLHRVLRASPERIYRAFLDAGAITKWLPPYGYTCKVYHMDADVGGTYKMAFTNFSTGRGHSFGGIYRELVPFEKIRYTDSFDDPALPGEMQTTVTLKQVSCGTDLNIMQEGIPEAIPVEMCYLGCKSRSHNSRCSSSRRFRIDEVTQAGFVTPPEFFSGWGDDPQDDLRGVI